MDALLARERGRLDAETMQAILRDRVWYPDALCRMPGDDEDGDVITFASVVAEPTQGRLSVAVEPPNEHPYRSYEFARTPNLEPATETATSRS